jgi:plastocyanin
MKRLLPVAAVLWTAATLQFAVGGQTRRIEMKNVAIMPAEVTVHVGDTVEWDNSDFVAHTATSKEGEFDVDIAPDQRGRFSASQQGTFAYICRYHPNMNGTIVVLP